MQTTLNIIFNLNTTIIIVSNYTIDEITPQEDKRNNCDINRSENNAMSKVGTSAIQDRNHAKFENAARRTLTSPYAVSNPVVIDKREEKRGNNAKESKNQSDLNKEMNENGSNIGLPPNGYILPGKMKLGNALNIPALNSVYLASMSQNSG